MSTVLKSPHAHEAKGDDAKRRKIHKCLAQDPVDLWELRELALSYGGLMEASLRRRVWSRLVGLGSSYTRERSRDAPGSGAGADPDATPKRSLAGFLERHNPNRGSEDYEEVDENHNEGIDLPPSHAFGSVTGNTIADDDEDDDIYSTAGTAMTYGEVGGAPKSLEALRRDAAREVDLIHRDVGRSVVFRYPKSVTMTPVPWTGRKRRTNSNSSDDTVKSDATPPGQASNERRGYGGGAAFSPAQKSTVSSPCRALTSAEISDRLAEVLEATVTHPLASGKIHYYQGLHDVAGVILHALDYDVRTTTAVVRRLCQSHFRDALRENFSTITWLLHVLLMPLLRYVDPLVHYSLTVLFGESSTEVSNLCLPWMITWLTHDIHCPVVSARLVDAFVASHPLLPLYMAVALLAHPESRAAIVAEESLDDDPATMFLYLQSLPSKIVADVHALTPAGSVPVQDIIEDALSIMRRVPPRSLLDLVDQNDFPRGELLQRISTVSMFKAPCSWSMAGRSTLKSSTPSSSQPSALTASPLTTTISLVAQLPLPSTSSGQDDCVRAKLASGVPVIMKSINDAPLNSRSWGSRRYRPRRRRHGRILMQLYRFLVSWIQLLHKQQQKPNEAIRSNNAVSCAS